MSKNKQKASNAANGEKKAGKAPTNGSKTSLLATDPQIVELFKAVQKNHDAHEKLWNSMAETIRASITYILLAGKLLATIKSRLQHGEFEKAIAANCTLSLRQVQRYMKLFNSQAILGKIDKDWKQKFTLVEALELVREYEESRATAAIEQDRTSQAESREAKAKSKPTAKAAARSKRRVGKPPTPSSVRSSFKVALQELGSFHERIEVIKKPETLQAIEVEAGRIVKECQALIEECKQQRVALKKSLKAKSTSRAVLQPTAKAARNTAKRQKEVSGSEAEPTKA